MCAQEDNRNAAIDEDIRELEHTLIVQVYIQDRAIDPASFGAVETLAKAKCGTDYSAASHLEDGFHIDGNECLVFDQKNGNAIEVVCVDKVHSASSQPSTQPDFRPSVPKTASAFDVLADGVRFELTVDLPPRRFSRPVP